MKPFFLFIVIGILATAACEESSAVRGQSNKGGNKTTKVTTPRTEVPAALLLPGTKAWSLSGGMNTLFTTGFWADHYHDLYGNIHQAGQYRFTDDGHFTMYTYYANNTACTKYVQRYSYYEGTIEVKGNTITFHPVKGRVKVYDVCNAGKSYDRAANAGEMKAVAKTYEWEKTEPVQGYPILNLKEPGASGRTQYVIK